MCASMTVHTPHQAQPSHGNSRQHKMSEYTRMLTLGDLGVVVGPDLAGLGPERRVEGARLGGNLRHDNVRQ